MTDQRDPAGIISIDGNVCRPSFPPSELVVVALVQANGCTLAAAAAAVQEEQWRLFNRDTMEWRIMKSMYQPAHPMEWMEMLALKQEEARKLLTARLAYRHFLPLSKPIG